MENAKNASSQEELLQLRNEGKINDAEYEDLLETLHKTKKFDTRPGTEDKPQLTRTSSLALASLVFALLEPFGSIPAIICGHLALRKIDRQSTLRGRGLALAGLIIGYLFLFLIIILSLTMYLSYRQAYDTEIAKRSAWANAIATSEIKRFPLNNLEGLITGDLTIDNLISSDGKGSLKIEATKQITVNLFETGDINIESARLIYQAKVKTENILGQVYLEMWCHFPVRGEFFSRGLQSALSGTTDWTTQEISFFLKPGEKPDNVKLNLVINGSGTVWIDDIRLSKGPLD